MIGISKLASALLLAAAQLLPPPAIADRPAATAVQVQFAPPVDRPMTYHVTTRRLGGDGALINFSLRYTLQWQRVGRGYQLNAVLQNIESDARPEVTRALTMMLQPLVGEEISYLVAPDGSRIDPIDADQLWARVISRIETASAAAERPEARQLGQLIAALPEAERDRLATADVRALVAPANDAIPLAASDQSGTVSTTADGTMRTIAKVEKVAAPIGGPAQSLDIDQQWTVDTDTGLVMRERQQSWMPNSDGAKRTLVEERLRVLEIAE